MIITLSEVKDVYTLVKVAQACVGDVVVKQNKYAVNAKSILGLFSLDLTQPIELSLEQPMYNDVKKIEEFCKRIRGREQ